MPPLKNVPNMQKPPKPDGTVYFSPMPLPNGKTLYVGFSGKQVLYLRPVSLLEQATVKAAAKSTWKMSIFQLGK
ncbi:MAG: hypothetical protein K8I82_08495 [Anaerolineae bacterium]|nr:hypothetical protein [Anaerolineae bacterium]